MYNTVAGWGFTLFILLGGFHPSWAQILWPGDINNNGVVNGVDALYWAAANGAEGPPREESGSDWEATVYTPWDLFFPDSTNYAFADCDGDGKVDEDDLEDVLLENFGLRHGELRRDQLSRVERENGIPLRIRSQQNVVKARDRLNLRLLLGTPARPVRNLLGLTFDLVFDAELIKQDGDAIELELEDDWQANEEDDLISFVQQDSIEQGRLTIGILSNKQAPISGLGDLGEVSIVIEDIAVGVYEAIEIEVDNIVLSTDELELIPIDEKPEKVRVPFEDAVTAIDPTEPAVDDIRIYPNPARDRINLEMAEPAHWEYVELTDLSGRQAGRYTVGQSSPMQLDLQELPAGHYFLRLVGKDRIQVLRFTLTR